jgi:hypothetical protein
MPHPPFHMENEGGAKVWKLELIKELQTQICQKPKTKTKTPYS